MNTVEYINKEFMRVWLKYYPKEYFNKRNNIKTKTFTEALNSNDIEYLFFKSLFLLREYTGYVKVSKIKIMLRRYSIENTIKYSLHICISLFTYTKDDNKRIEYLQQIALNCIEYLIKE